MKKAMKLVSLVLAVVMLLGCLTACGSKSATTDATTSTDTPSTDASTAASSDGGEIVIALISNTTGDYAQYGQPVRDGAMLYINQLNAKGGINGKQVKVLEYDDKGDGVEAVNAYNLACDNGITAVFGATLTGTTIALADATYEDNMPQITASATAAGVTMIDPEDENSEIRTNVFRSCFIDPFQGEKMAQYAKEKLGYTKAAVIVQTGNDYAAGLNEAFKAKCAELGITVVAEEGYAKGDKDFNAQLTNIKAADPEFIFCPNYYEDDGMIVKQARALGLTVPFLGGDGWDGVVKYASAEELEGTFYCSAYAPGSTDAVKAFEEAYTAAYGTDTLNMFAANAYDAAMVMCAALAKAEETGEAPASDAYKQAVIDAIKTEGANVVGITSEAGYTFDANNNPIKDAVIMTITNGEAVYKETF